MKQLTQKLQKEIKKLHSPQGRKKSSLYVIEGIRCCEEALSRLPKSNIYAVITTKNITNINCDIEKKYTAEDKLFSELSQTHNPQGILVLAHKHQSLELSYIDTTILVLDRLQDPGNIGTILRTALAVGIKEVILIDGTVDPFNPKAIRAGMGAQFSLKFKYFKDIKELSNHPKLQNRKIWLTTPHQGISCYDKNFELNNSILIFGEEANGIKDFSLGEKTMIPTLSNIESLNVAQAATIYLFESLRQKLTK